MKIYTRTGDDGETGLYGGARVLKDHGRVEAYGTVDELNSALGIVGSQVQSYPSLQDLIARIQRSLFDLGAELATPAERLSSPLAARLHLVGEAETTALEQEIDRMEAELLPLQSFILPGGSAAAAACHLARSICRRAERRVVTLAQQEQLRPEVLHYLNRLSDLLFVLARYVNHLQGQPDLFWHSQE